MRKVISNISIGSLLILILFVSTLSTPFSAHAQLNQNLSTSPGSCTYYSPIPITNGKLPTNSIYQGLVVPTGASYACAYYGGGGYEFYDAQGNRVGATTGSLMQPATNYDQNGVPTVSGCNADIRSWSAFFNSSCWGPMISGVLSGALVSLASWFLTATGYLFDWAVTKTILQFGSLVNQNVINGINTAWSAGRDISNIIIIGLFVFIAIMTILGSNEYGVRRMLARVLIIAILINFSLLFTKLIVDASNFTAVQLYGAASDVIGQPVENGAAGPAAANTVQSAGISGAFMKYAGVSGFGNTTDAVGNLAKNQGSWIALIFGIVTALLFGVAAIVLLYGTFLLITRALVLIFLMITASLAFASYLWPKISAGGWGWSAWWNALLKNAVFAPLLMFFLWVTLTLGKAFANTTNGSLGRLLTNPQSTVDINALLGYMLVIGLLFISFRLSSSFASAVGGLNVGQGAFDFLARTTGGGIARGGTLAWQSALSRFQRSGAAAPAAPRAASRANSAPLANIPQTVQPVKQQSRQRLQFNALPTSRTQPQPTLAAPAKPAIRAETKPALPAPEKEDAVKAQREANARIESNQKELADLLKKQTDATNNLTQTNQAYAESRKTIDADADDRTAISNKYSEDMIKKQIEVATANLDPAKRAEVEQDIRRNSEEQRASELRHQNDRIEQARAKLTQISGSDPALAAVEKRVGELRGQIDVDKKFVAESSQPIASQTIVSQSAVVNTIEGRTISQPLAEASREARPDVVSAFRGANKRIVRAEIFRPNATDVSMHTEATIKDNPIPPQQKAA